MIHSKKLLMNDMVTLTVSTTPASATCILTYNNVQYSTKTLTVPKGTTISYSVYYSTYGTTSGSITMDKDKTLTCTGTSGTSYTEINFSQPILTDNGTLDGSSFAVQAQAEAGTGWKAWKAFSDTGNGWAGGTTKNWYIFYNPNGLKVKSLAFTRYSSNFLRKFNFLGSNDNSTWTTIKSDLDTNMYNSTGPNTVDINSTAYYQYHKIDAVTFYTRTAFKRLGVTAVYQSQTTTYYWNTSTN